VADNTPAAEPAPVVDVPAADVVSPVTVVEARYDSALVTALVAELQAEYVARYGGPDDAPAEPDEFAPPHGSFLVAEVGGTPVGMVGLRRLGAHGGDPGDGTLPGLDPERTAELKRLYVRQGHRRRGHARRILHLAEARARALGYRHLVLETGLEQPEAMALYATEGYRAVPPYGYYRCAPLSRCFAKDL